MRLDRSRILLIAGLVVAVGVGALAADVLSQLGMQPKEAKDVTLEVITNGYGYSGNAARALKATAPAARAALAQGAVAWMKAYSATPEFKQAYLKDREDHKPTPPEFTGTPEEEFARQQAAQKAEQAKNAEEMKKVLPTLPEEQRKAIEEGLKAAAAMTAQMDTPEMRKMQLQGIVADREGKKRQYNEDMTRWQADYPENPNLLVAKRLRAFLEMSKDIDFSAALKDSDGRKVFVNPEYQSKPDDWKRCFRAGKEATTAARAAVQAWLAELPK